MQSYTQWIRAALVLTVFLFAQAAFGQTISGVVTSTENNEGLPGVNVVVKGTSTGAVTNAKGEFAIRTAAKDGALVFSFIGYTSKEIPLGGQSVINVSLAPDDKLLSEVVVVGYGTVKRANATSAVASMGAREIEERPINRIENALAGQMPGVYVQTTNGEPGADLQIRVRGTGSLNASNEPLYVVDGVPVENLRGINPQDVKSIDVLKDASSAAIYGSRGNNGVVIVTTKRGEKGKARLNFTGFTGIQTLERRIPMMSAEEWIQQRKEGIDEAWVNRGISLKKDYKATDPMEFRAKELGITMANPNVSLMYDPKWAYGSDSLAFTDWQDAFFRQARMQNYQLGVAGGTDDVTYNVSGAYLDQDGIVIGTNLRRATLRANFDAKLRKGMRFGMTLAPSMEWSTLGRVDGKDQQAMNAVQMPPVGPLDAGVYVGAQPYGAYAWSGRYVSPVAVMERTSTDGTRSRLNANMYLNVDLYKGLQLQLTGGMDNNNWMEQQWVPTSASRDWATATNEGALSRSRRTQEQRTRYLFQSVLNYNRKFGDHSVNSILGYSVERYGVDRSQQENNKFPNDWTYLFDNTSSTVGQSQITGEREALISYFGRVQYDYKEKFLLSGSLRRDGSSKFGADNRWGLFPALSAAWRVSAEPFMANVPFISDLKLRASWGVTGNNRITNNAQFSLLGVNNYSLNGAMVAGYSPSTIENLNLGWEQTDSYNVGMDLGILKNSVQLTLDAYRRVTSDLLFRTPVSSTTGFTTSWQNIGDIENKGIELGVSTRGKLGPVRWTGSYNVSYNQNKVLKLGYDNTPIPTGFSNLTQMIQVGQPIGVFMLYDVVGVYKTQAEVDAGPKMTNTRVGDSKYRDVNGDGKIDNSDRTIVGSPQPKFIFGFNNTFTYRNFDLTLFINAQQGGKVYSMIGRSIDRPGMGYLYNKLAKWSNRWKSEQDPGDGMTPSINATTGGYYDTRWLYSSDYIRVKNVALGYNLPSAKFYNRARVYISVENAYIWHNYTGGFTPEAANNEGGDYGGYPQSRTFSVGVNLNL
ncbi:SusC/RagA family TonB-linked outer membrane protein [Tellurirhabdus rosea]|uniref:SusC/RagA family TonB-linked outer membrane protein n=1 Tax=Tellurirhabdus rosea TaxID=2674997 RepID=UPI0022572A0B|nr:TonB-dependent receptor [Tellurirhabdus rosea]